MNDYGYNNRRSPLALFLALAALGGGMPRMTPRKSYRPDRTRKTAAEAKKRPTQKANRQAKRAQRRKGKGKR
jgi:hypothetical protein